MRFIATALVVLISGSLVLAQQIKEPGVKVRPAPGLGVHNSVVTLPPANNSSAADLARIEQQTARVRSAKPVVHHPATVTAAPPVDLGKNKPIHVSRSPQSHNPASH